MFSVQLVDPTGENDGKTIKSSKECVDLMGVWQKAIKEAKVHIVLLCESDDILMFHIPKKIRTPELVSLLQSEPV